MSAGFIRICEEGKFYVTIRALVLTPEEDALISDKDFKAAFFGKVFYSSEKRNWVWRQKFAAEFKEVSKYISSLKAESYKDMPRELSRRESTIMLEGVAAKLLDAGASFYSLHDAIYAAAKDLSLIEQLIRAEFAAHGVGVTIKMPEHLPAAPVSFPDEDELLARLEAEFAAHEADDALDALEAVGAGADDDFFKD